MARLKKESPSALKVLTCGRKVRRMGQIERCGKEYLAGQGQCPITTHLHKMKTGHCLQGWCEGSKAVDWRGNPAPTCKMMLTCPCDCHTMLDKMFAMTGHERLPMDVSGYVPPHRDYWMPSDAPDVPLDASSDDPGIPTPETLEDPLERILATRTERDFGPTPTGRTAKGQLEGWVLAQCDIWVIDKPGFPCTPKWISDHIADDEGVSPPSVGAVDAVFKRWVKLGFAVIESKPTRFTGYTDEGSLVGLDVMKEKAKKSARLKQADDRRNLRR